MSNGVFQCMVCGSTGDDFTPCNCPGDDERAEWNRNRCEFCGGMGEEYSLDYGAWMDCPECGGTGVNPE